MRREAGFTMIELMFVVVIVAILTSIAVVAYTKWVRKARAGEIAQMFGEMKAKEEAYHAEKGVYLGLCPTPDASGLCTEGDYFPLTVNGNAIDITGGVPASWTAARISPGKGALYCQYEVVAGLSGSTTGMSTYGQLVYNNAAPATNWYYLLGQCDWDHNSAVNAQYWQRGDLNVMGSDNTER
jgi:prepilin-type N-terminal cleavage/methylation domain-containing protein